MEFSEMQKQAYETACLKGWHDNQVTFGEMIALVHSELSEALEEHRAGHKASETYYRSDGNSEEYAIMNDQYLCALSLLMEAMASQLSYYEQM